jgi:hypothetical protein
MIVAMPAGSLCYSQGLIAAVVMGAGRMEYAENMAGR